MNRLKAWLQPERTKVLVAGALLLVIGLGLGQGWVFADTMAPRPAWALPDPLGMLAWTVAVYLMVPVMMLNLPLVLAFDLDLFHVPWLTAGLAVVMAYLWAAFFVTAFRILRRQSTAD